MFVLSALLDKPKLGLLKPNKKTGQKNSFLKTGKTNIQQNKHLRWLKGG